MRWISQFHLFTLCPKQKVGTCRRLARSIAIAFPKPLWLESHHRRDFFQWAKGQSLSDIDSLSLFACQQIASPQPGSPSRKNGIISQLTRVLVGLYEEPERPANARDTQRNLCVELNVEQHWELFFYVFHKVLALEVIFRKYVHVACFSKVFIWIHDFSRKWS